jgi:hypothetical protein
MGRRPGSDGTFTVEYPGGVVWLGWLDMAFLSDGG